MRGHLIKARPAHLVVLTLGVLAFWPHRHPPKQLMFVAALVRILNLAKKAGLVSVCMYLNSGGKIHPSGYSTQHVLDLRRE